MPRSAQPLRTLNLKDVFSRPNMERAWRRTVRQGMRRQALLDLHDFLDVHRHLRPFVNRVRTDVISGRYRADEAEVVRLEKRNGICRRVMLPSPADAIVLQTLVDALEPSINRAKPTDAAFYSRSHDGPSVDKIDGTFAYPWWILWPQFQERIWKFTAACPFVVVTDVASYFDCIPLTGLRNAVASTGRFRQGVLDFLFYMLEAFVWRPEYIALNGIGLPQINFDAPRLLAHCYLFPADRFLDGVTKGNFVRWMDDIDFGVDSIHEGREVLGRLDALLNMHGIRLNHGKTRILSSQEAAQHFWVQENRQLNVTTNSLKYGSHTKASAARVRAYLHARLRRFLAAGRKGNWEKVLKRYFTAFGKLQDPVLQPLVPQLMDQYPGARDSIFFYYFALGYSPSRFKHIEHYLRSGECLDDVSLFHAAHLLVSWHIPHRSVYRQRSVDLGEWLRSTAKGSMCRIVSGLWLLAKYASKRTLQAYIRKSEQVWTRSPWAARQVAAVTPRLTETEREKVRAKVTASGLLEALRVITTLDEIASPTGFDRQLSDYLRHPAEPPYGYPLPKVLVAIAVLTGSSSLPTRQNLQNDLLRMNADSVLSKLLDFTIR